MEIKNIFKHNYVVMLSVIIFAIITISGYPFYKAIILLLELIVVIEVIKMISDFVEKRKLRLRFVIDIFIIFLIRDVIILSTEKNKDYFDILFLLFVIFVFFIFRILTLKYSPSAVKKMQSVTDE
jgi:uncharacterized membrane protein (DUF373 family)